MAWLGETLTDRSGATRAPRRTKDLIEEALFERRRNLFSDLSVVLLDTTSLMFTAAVAKVSVSMVSPKTIDLTCVRWWSVSCSTRLADRSARRAGQAMPPTSNHCCSLLPIVTRLRDRFGIRHMCVVADRGMISADTIAELEARGIDYILGARERSTSEVREVVLTDREPTVPLTIPRARGS